MEQEATVGLPAVKHCDHVGQELATRNYLEVFSLSIDRNDGSSQPRKSG